MSTNPGPEKPFHFSSDALNSALVVGLAGAITIPCICVFVRAFKDIRDGVRERQAWRKSGKLKGGADDVENQLGPKTDLEMSGEEKNGGLCELEQPGLPELSAIGIVEMWDEGCAKEICGKIMAIELDADEQTIPTSKVPNLATDVESDEQRPTESLQGDEIISAMSEASNSVTD